MQENTAPVIDTLSTEAASEYTEPTKATTPTPPSIVAVTKLLVEDRAKAFAPVNKNMTRVRKVLDALSIDGVTPTLAADSEGNKLIIQDGEVIGQGKTNADAFVAALADIPTEDLVRLLGPTLVAMLMADKLIGSFDESGKYIGFIADNRRNRRALGIPTKENAKKLAAEAAKRQEQQLVDETNVEPEGIPTGGEAGNEYAGEGADASEAEATA